MLEGAFSFTSSSVLGWAGGSMLGLCAGVSVLGLGSRLGFLRVSVLGLECLSGLGSLGLGFWA